MQNNTANTSRQRLYALAFALLGVAGTSVATISTSADDVAQAAASQRGQAKRHRTHHRDTAPRPTRSKSAPVVAGNADKSAAKRSSVAAHPAATVKPAPGVIKASAPQAKAPAALVAATVKAPVITQAPVAASPRSAFVDFSSPSSVGVNGAPTAPEKSSGRLIQPGAVVTPAGSVHIAASVHPVVAPVRAVVTIAEKSVVAASPAKPAPVVAARKAAPVASAKKTKTGKPVLVPIGVAYASRGAAAPPAWLPVAAAANASQGRDTELMTPSGGFGSAERRVSLDFVAADINDVLKALSLQSGVNIVTGADVKGIITVTLKRVALSDALDMVARLSGFQYAEFGNAYVVGTPASVAAITQPSYKPDQMVTEFIPYRYATTFAVTKALGERFPGMRLPDAGDKNEVVNPATPRLLVLSDTKDRVALARTFVEKLEQAVSGPSNISGTDLYVVKYASPDDLVRILARFVPTVSATAGPTQRFNSGSSGASASYSTPSLSGSSGGGGGTANPAGATASANSANVLLLSGSPGDLARAREVLAQVDIRIPQMMFEARVVDVNSDDARQLGLRYDFSRTVQVGNSEEARKIGTIGPGGTLPASGGQGFGAIFRSPYTIGVNLDALETNNKARTLASPNLSALDGQPAVVFIGDQVKYVINIQQTPQGQNIQTETATVGITLKVTGKASPDGTITLYVHPEVSTISSFLTLANGISLPQIATRFVDTTIRVKDGETIGIGGLIREQDIKNIQKVPFLGDMPFLGQLFRSETKRKGRSEIMVFITSRVIKD